MEAVFRAAIEGCRARTGALLSFPAGEQFPSQLAGLLAGIVGMLIGSLGPQAIANSHGSHHRLAGGA